MGFFYGATATSGPGPPFVKTSQSLSDTPHSVALLWTRDQPEAETSALQHTTLKQTEIRAHAWIRTRNPRKQAAAKRHLGPRGQ